MNRNKITSGALSLYDISKLMPSCQGIRLNGKIGDTKYGTEFPPTECFEDKFQKGIYPGGP